VNSRRRYRSSRIDEGDRLVRDRLCVAVGRVEACNHDQRNTLRHLVDRVGDDLVKGLLGGDLLIVVQHQGCVGREPGEQRSEKPSGEARYIPEILRRERRQRRPFLAREGLASLPK
jgi:hypothetical protein